MESKSHASQGKIEQLQEVGIDFISDETLQEFLQINLAHLGLPLSDNQDEDVSFISWYTRNKFIVAIQIFEKFQLINSKIPCILPYVLNIVSENSPRLDLQPHGFTGKLFPPQASILKRMLDVESSPPVFTIGNNQTRIYGGLLNERLSFGKTYCLPALICEKQMPYNPNSLGTNDNYSIFNDMDVIKTNFIVCGTKVAKEWRNNLKNFTSLDFQVIEKAAELDTLEISITKKEYPDVLVVKDGEITWKGKKLKALDHALNILKGKCFARAIYDDYDMLKLQKRVIEDESLVISDIPDALFTWFVSGTDSMGALPPISFHSYYNGEKKLMSMYSVKIILGTVAGICCNKEYSSVEYNIPRVDIFYTGIFDEDTEDFNEVSIFDVVSKIIKGEHIDCIPNEEHNNPALLMGTKDAPYTYNPSTMKILVAIKDKNDQVALVSDFIKVGIKAVKLTKANDDKFRREDSTVAVCGNLFGVNLGFLTHIVINMVDFDENERTQIIGRGQRLSRKENLQVYLA